jgi:hypothetical protein
VLFTKFYTLIERLGWNEFAKHPIKPCLALVHEFYANLHLSTRKDEVRVFGRNVKYSATQINWVLRIPPLEGQDALEELSEQDNRPSIDEMTHTLTLGRGGELVPRTHAIKIGSLCEEARWWRKFMTGRILGSIKEGETTIEQQIILFYILLGRRFDVGRLINTKINTIKAKIRSDTMGKLALSFLSLITLLCKNVQRPEGSYDSETMQPITDKHISRDRLFDPSVLEFHQAHWGNHGSPSWVPPQIALGILLDMQGSGVGSPHQAPFDQNAWQEFQDVQEQRHTELIDRMDSMNLRMDGVYERMDGTSLRMDGMYGRMDGMQQQLATMQDRMDYESQQRQLENARRDEFYRRMEAHFSQSSQRPPSP